MNYEPREEVSYNIPESISENGSAKNLLVRMPKTISTAINNITREIKMLGKDEKMNSKNTTTQVLISFSLLLIPWQDILD